MAAITVRERLFTVSDINKDENEHAFRRVSSYRVTDVVCN